MKRLLPQACCGCCGMVLRPSRTALPFIPRAMTSTPPFIRAYIDSQGSVAEVCLLVQQGKRATVTWQWEMPYLLWAYWGTDDTATWLCEQFRQHDSRTFNAVGSQLLRGALQRGLERHRRFHHISWLMNCQP
mgnify:CR=1 FL=1